MSLETTYRNRQPSGHWFDADTMRFFRTRVSSCTQWPEGEDGPAYFITTEKPPHGRRRSSVRVMDPDGVIETIGPFCERSPGWASKVLNRAVTAKLNGSDHLAGKIMLGCIWRAKELWEAGDGTLTPEAEQQRRNADHWAGEAGMSLDWSTGLHPTVTYRGHEHSLSEWRNLLLLDLYD